MKIAEKLKNKITEAQKQETRKYKKLEYEVWHEPRKGYFIKGKGEIKTVIPKDFFDKLDDALDHAEESIDGYLDD